MILDAACYNAVSFLPVEEGHLFAPDAPFSELCRTGGAGGGDVGDGFFGIKLLLDPIIMRRIRAARADCVSLANIMHSAAGFPLPVWFFFDLCLSLSSWTDLSAVSPAVVWEWVADCDLCSCCFECTNTPGLSGHLPTALAADAVRWLENDSEWSSPYPGGGLGLPGTFVADWSVQCCVVAGLAPEIVYVALPSGLQ